MANKELTLVFDKAARELLALAYYRGVADAQYQGVEVSDAYTQPTGAEAVRIAVSRLCASPDQILSITGGDGRLGFTEDA